MLKRVAAAGMLRPRAALLALVALLVAGCGSASGSASSNAGFTASTAGLTTVRLTSGGHQRTYELYAPPAVGKNHPLPLVLVYHGAGDTALNEARETSLLSMDRRLHDMILVYPQGYEDTWNEGAGHTPAERAGINDVAFTSAILRRVESHYPVDMRRVVATGISNGALLTELLGCRLAANLTLIAPVEGELPVTVSPGCSPSSPVAVYEVHGTADAAIPFGGGHFNGAGGGTSVLSAPASAERWAALDRCAAHPRQSGSGSVRHITYTGCRDQVTVTLDVIEGGQHQWPADFAQTLVHVIGSLSAKRRAVVP